ncbi:class A beta-lactamase [Sphingomonas oleivorans]|uniref:Beta-lactamase n=1 Tax=Sphingomonas oleivorans TaxID=1735121 RepID=A0A2T5G341_9SPHN|nr:class A beta-lactamase [Sphingomonas oleivorans]PTQ13556.1 class A beta-lactamase [Sphingomonas oleivorans]
MLDRRGFTGLIGGGLLLGVGGMPLAAAGMRRENGDRQDAERSAALNARIARIEAESGGRLGVFLLDSGSGPRFGYRARELFPMCSTFKFLLAAMILARVDRGKERLDRRIRFGPEAIVTYAPITGKHVGGDGMSIAELCEATMTLSDNVAANLLLDTIGGPTALTAWLRTIGDKVTRLDRNEPSLNEARAGDPRDTTTPLAMLGNLRKLLIGRTLSAPSRALLTSWMVGNRTGDRRLRAGLPSGWRVGDKTGTGENGTYNDIAIIWPPERPPLLMTAYLTQARPDRGDATLAEVARAMAELAG